MPLFKRRPDRPTPEPIELPWDIGLPEVGDTVRPPKDGWLWRLYTYIFRIER